jgi:hypothetical protein
MGKMNTTRELNQDPVTKSQRITNGSGTITSTIDLDPWDGETSRSSNHTAPTIEITETWVMFAYPTNLDD